MPIVDAKTFESGAGLDHFAFGTSRPCDDPQPVAFLNALSKRLLTDKAARAYPDLATFAYFCRKANTTRALEALPKASHRFGWGTAIHIAPSNIPVNFAFSWVMGLLSGNSNIVRLPSRIFDQSALLVEAVDAVLPDFQNLKYKVAFIQSERDSPRLNALIKQTHALVVWGGDATASQFRALPKRPACVELYFPDRVSSALIDAAHYLSLPDKERVALATAFFNDSFLVDQNACSSPGIVFWHGTSAGIEKAKALFWDTLTKLTQNTYQLDPVAKIDKMLNVMHMADTLDRPIALDHTRQDVWLSPDDGLRDLPLRFGMFVELDVDSPAQIASYLRDNEQTLTVSGLDPHDVFTALKPTGCRPDRIVPMGRALDIGLHWDGKDTLSLLSRRVEVG